VLNQSLVLRSYQASKATVSWYTKGFKFRLLDFLFPSEFSDPDFVSFDNNIDDSLTNFINYDSNAESSNLERNVEAAAEGLFKHLKTSVFNGSACKLSEDTISVQTTIDGFLDSDGLEKRCVVKGICDRTFRYGNCGFYWFELKNRDMDLSNDSCYKASCAQIAVYMKADLEDMLGSINYVPSLSYGIVTNGNYWVVVAAATKIVEGKLDITWMSYRTIHYKESSSSSSYSIDPLIAVKWILYVTSKQAKENMDSINQHHSPQSNTGRSNQDKSSGKGHDSQGSRGSASGKKRSSNAVTTTTTTRNTIGTSSQSAKETAKQTSGQSSLQILPLTMKNVEEHTIKHSEHPELEFWNYKLKKIERVVFMTTDELFEREKNTNCFTTFTKG